MVDDALFRKPMTCSLTGINSDWKVLLPVVYSKNKFACDLMDGVIRDDKYMVVNDIMFYKGRISLVPKS